MTQPPRFLFVGYYGHGLVGDEAVLDVMVREFRRRWPDCAISATSADAGPTAALGIRTVPLYDVRRIVAAIDTVDLVVVGGGGVFNEYAPFEPLTSFHDQPAFNALCAEIPAIAAAKGKPSMIFAAGVERHRSDVARERTRAAFALATRSCVRDSSSLEMLAEMGLPPGDVERTCDPAAGIHPAALDRIATLNGLGLNPDLPVLTLSLRHWDSTPGRLSDLPQAWEGALVAGLGQFVRETGVQLLAAPHQLAEGWVYSDDGPLYDRIFAALKGARTAIWDGDMQPSVIAGVQALGDAHLAMRHHGVILAAAARTPCAALAYAPKVRGAMQDLGLADFVLDLEDVSPDIVLSLMRRLFSEGDAIRRRLGIMAEKREADLARGVTLAAEALAVGASAPVADMEAFRRSAAGWLAMAADSALDSSSAIALTQIVHQALEAPDAATRLRDPLAGLARRWPESGALSYLLGFVELAAGDDMEASLLALSRAIALDYQPAFTLTVRAEAHARLGDYPAAYADLDEAGRLEPQLERIALVRAAVCAMDRPAD